MSSILIDTRTGPITQADGAGDQPLRQSRMGSLVVSDGHGRYWESASRKFQFTAYAAAVQTSAVGTAMVGLQLWNGSPLTSPVNLVLTRVYSTIFVTSASATRILLATGTGQVSAPTSQTGITRVSNNFIGGPGPQATATSAGTFTNAPTAFLPLLHNTVAIATTGEDPGAYVDLEGSVIIPPQCYFAFAVAPAALTAGAADHAVMWEEVPA